MFRNPILTAYIEAFEQLTPESLPQLGELFSDAVYFKDPFNAVKGRHATLKVFEHMFATTQSPTFIIIDAAMVDNIALLYWKFYFVLPSNKSKQMIEGMSRVRFDENGLVNEHIDHWDATEQVYSKVPILSWFIMKIQKRLSASN